MTAASISHESEAEPTLELVARLTVSLATALDLGETAAGLRRIIPIVGGTVDGPLLTGEIIAGGADWNTWNEADRTGILFAQYAIRLDDGTVIGVTNTGRHTIPAPDEPIFTSPVLEAPPGRYGWLNHAAFIGTLRPSESGEGTVQLEFWRARMGRRQPIDATKDKS